MAESRITVLNPCGETAPDIISLASRLPELKHCKIGMLNNDKPNADIILEAISKLLVENGEDLQFKWYTKPAASKAAPKELLTQIASECDAVVAAVGD